MENLCVSLEWAQKMKDKGFNQDSLFSWVYWPNAPKDNKDAKPKIVLSTDSLCRGQRATVARAYTFQELSDILPWIIKKKEQWYYFFISKDEKEFKVEYMYYESYEGYKDSIYQSFKNKSCADAMAEMACYLKDEGIIK